MMPSWELIAGLLVGVGLSAASGFRLFIPLLTLSIANLFFHLPLPPALYWLGSETAFFILVTATLFEIGAYYVPWLDNLLDTIATPLAMISGTLLTGAFVGEMDPVWRWSLALLAGGTAAGTVQSITSGARLASSGLTAGLTNPILATAEGVLATIFSTLALLSPILTLGALAVLGWLGFKFMGKAPWRRKKQAISTDNLPSQS